MQSTLGGRLSVQRGGRPRLTVQVQLLQLFPIWYANTLLEQLVFLNSKEKDTLLLLEPQSYETPLLLNVWPYSNGSIIILFLNGGSQRDVRERENEILYQAKFLHRYFRRIHNSVTIYKWSILLIWISRVIKIFSLLWSSLLLREEGGKKASLKPGKGRKLTKT